MLKFMFILIEHVCLTYLQRWTPKSCTWSHHRLRASLVSTGDKWTFQCWVRVQFLPLALPQNCVERWEARPASAGRSSTWKRSMPMTHWRKTCCNHAAIRQKVENEFYYITLPGILIAFEGHWWLSFIEFVLVQTWNVQVRGVKCVIYKKAVLCKVGNLCVILFSMDIESMQIIYRIITYRPVSAAQCHVLCLSIDR